MIKPLDKSNSFSGYVLTTDKAPCGAARRAKRGRRRKAPGAEGAPEPREGLHGKLECDSTGLDSAVAYEHPAVGGKACSARTGYELIHAC